MHPKNVTRFRVRYGETDPLGIVNSAVYLTWFELGRTELLRDLGIAYADLEPQGVCLPVIEAHVDYRRPLHYDEEVEIETRLEGPVRSRMRFDYTIRLRGDGEPAAVGHTVHAFTDRSGRPRKPPEFLRQINTDTPGNVGPCGRINTGRSP